MQFKKIFLPIFFVFSTINCFADEATYKWKFSQKTEIKKLEFKSKEAEERNNNLRKAISQNFSENVCVTENDIFNFKIQEVLKYCDIVDKKTTPTNIQVRLACDEDQSVNIILNKDDNGNFIGTSLGKSETDEYDLEVVGKIYIKKNGTCKN